MAKAVVFFFNLNIVKLSIKQDGKQKAKWVEKSKMGGEKAKKVKGAKNKQNRCIIRALKQSKIGRKKSKLDQGLDVTLVTRVAASILLGNL